MVNKNFALATLAVAVTTALLGYVLFEVMLGSFFMANQGTVTGVFKETAVYWQVVVGQLAGASLLVLVLSWKGVESVGDGFKTGAVYGTLLSVGYGFLKLGMMNLTTMNAVLVEVALHFVLLGVAGAVATVVLRRGR